jgi:phage gp45-like
MVQRSTPLTSVIRAYTGGGARSMIDTVDDNKTMQEGNNCQGMRGESWPSMEAPQNYGFTSVVADASKVGGMIKNCAEGFISFMGGNRSFPVVGVMDDRRHRLMNLAKDAAKGAVAMFGQKDWGQQFLNTDDGMYMTGNTQKKVRLQLVDNKNGQQQQAQQQPGASGPAGAQAWKVTNPPGAVELPDGRVVIRSKSGVEFDVERFDARAHVGARTGGAGGGNGSSAAGGAGGGNGSSAAGGGQSTGQKTLHKEDSSQYFDMTTGSLHQCNGSSNHEVKGDQTVGHMGTNERSYRADKGHTHIKNDGGHVWVQGGVCFKSVPFVVKPDPCS